ncbi:MAG: phage tail tube protein, partial [Vulcanimicrobiaceae bacterium]
MPIAPSGEKTSLGIGKEASYGSAATPTVFLICTDTSFNGTNSLLDRLGARKRVGRSLAATGMYMGKGTLTAEADPDNLGALLALTMGAETVAANAGNPIAPTISTTLSAATTYIGPAVWCTPAAMTNIVPGVQLNIDAAANIENVTVKAVTATQFAVALTKTHLSGAAVVAGTLSLGYDHTFTLASPRNSFTSQIGRVVDNVNAIGGKIQQLDLSMTEKSILEAKATVEYQVDAFIASPTTPAYSTLYPFIFETPGNQGKVLGAQSDATIMSWNCQVQTGLITDYPSFGGGRLRAQLPETLTKVMGSLTLGFETET